MRHVLASVTLFLGVACTSFAQPIQEIDLGDQRFEIEGEPLALDLDADGVADSVCRPSRCSPELVGVYVASGEGVEFSTSSPPSSNALALNAGENVADAFNWGARAHLLANCGYSGEWRTPRTAFVGYRVLGNPVRYGWIRVTNTDGTARGFIFHNAAFDTSGGLILAGEDNSRTISPRLNPPGATYSNAQTVTLTTPTDQAEIRYTLDGSTPGPDSPMVANGGTVQVTESGTTIRVAATSPNLPPSYVRAETYTLECANPRLSALYGQIPIRISIDSPTTDAIIRYSTDGTDPLPPHGQVYTGPIDIQTPTRLRAITTKPGFLNSGIVQAEYRLTDIVYQREDGRQLRDSIWTPFDFNLDGRVDLLMWSGELGIWTSGDVVAEFDYGLIPFDGGEVIGPMSPLLQSDCPQTFDDCSKAPLFDNGAGWGSWFPGTERMLGFAFRSSQGRHFGWMRVRAEEYVDYFLPATVVDWAYERTPELPISAGDPGPVPCPPRFTVPPSNLSSLEGAAFSLDMRVSGPSLSFEWLRNGQAITDPRFSGTHSPTLTCAAADPADTGFYSVTVTSPCGVIHSDPVIVQVDHSCTPFQDGSTLELNRFRASVEVPDHPAIDLTTSGTLECWVFTGEQTEEGAAIIKERSQNYTAPSYEMTVFGPLSDVPVKRVHAQFVLDPYGLVSVSTEQGTIDPNTWYHVSATIDTPSNIMRLFVDGVLVQSTSTTSDGFPLSGRQIYQSSFPLKIGAANQGYSSLFGRIDEVRIWNIARTPEQIAQFRHQAIDPATPGLMAYYRFNEGSGLDAFDSSVNGIHGRLINGAGFGASNACCPADVTNDDTIDTDDLLLYFSLWDASDIRADANQDRGIDSDDIIEFFSRWDAGC